MKALILKFCSIGFFLGLGLFLFIFQFIDSLEESTHMVLSYLAMFVLTLLVIPVIKKAKTQFGNGQISFKKAFSIGIVICFAIALGVGLADYLFTAILEPNFIENYISDTLSTMKQNLSVTEFKTQKKDFLLQMETFGSSLMMAIFMILNVLTIGLVVSITTALILKTKS